MKKLPLLFLLVVLSTLSVVPQSGRRISSTSTPTPAAPIQPPLNPEPEIKSARPLTELLFLPESILERQINGLNSRSFRLSDFHGKVVVINIWASWCGPCRREVPEYEKVRKAFVDRDVVFVGLTTDDPRFTDKVQNFLRDVSFGFRLGWADRELARTLMNGQSSIPQTMVLDADGRIVSHWRGYVPNKSGERLKQTVEQALTRE